MKGNLLGGLALILVIAFGGYFYTHQPLPAVGAVTGPDSSFPCETHNGTGSCFSQRGFQQATTTVFAAQSPTYASSTLRAGSGCFFRVSSTTASLVPFAKATTPFATTTLLGSQVAIAASAEATIQASTTAAQLNLGTNIFAPGTWFVVGMQTTDKLGTFSPTGSCAPVFDVLS